MSYVIRLANAAPEWQARNMEVEQATCGACPLEGHVRWSLIRAN